MGRGLPQPYPALDYPSISKILGLPNVWSSDLPVRSMFLNSHSRHIGCALHASKNAENYKKNHRKRRNAPKSTSESTVGVPWTHFGGSGVSLGRFSGALGHSWALIGSSWGLLGRSWDALGRLLGAN